MIGWLGHVWRDRRLDDEVVAEIECPQAGCNDTATEERSVSFFDFIFGDAANDSDTSETSYTSASESSKPDVYRSHGIEIRDSGFLDRRQFRSRIESALELLEGRAPEMLHELQQYTRCITDTNENLSHSKPWDGGIHISRDMRGIESLAGVLVHEGRHNKINDAGNNNAAQELECFARQIECLKKVGGCWSEIRFYEQQDGMHYLKGLNG